MVAKKVSKKKTPAKAAKKTQAKMVEARPDYVHAPYSPNYFTQDGRLGGLSVTKAGNKHARRLADGYSMDVCRAMATLWLRATAIKGARERKQKEGQKTKEQKAIAKAKAPAKKTKAVKKK